MRPAAAGAGHRPARAGAGRRVDRYWLAGHHGGRRAKRTERGAGTKTRPCLAARPGPGLPGRSARAGRDRSAVMTATIPAGVETARDLVGPAIAAAVRSLSPDVRSVAAYHLGLADDGSQPVSADGRPGGAGKALRPA